VRPRRVLNFRESCGQFHLPVQFRQPVAYSIREQSGLRLAGASECMTLSSGVQVATIGAVADGLFGAVGAGRPRASADCGQQHVFLRFCSANFVPLRSAAQSLHLRRGDPQLAPML